MSNIDGGNYSPPKQMKRSPGLASMGRGQPAASMRAANQFKIALIIFIALLPLGFIPLQAIGLGFLKPTQIAVLLLLLFVPVILRNEPIAKSVLMFVLTGVAVRLSVLLVSLAWSDHMIDGLTFIVIDSVSAIATLVICAMASRYSLPDLAGIFAWGVLGLAISLHLAIFIGHAASGRFSLSVAFDAIASGQFRQLKTLYFVGALQGLGLQGAASFFTEVAPKATNAFGSSVLTPTLAAIHLAAADKVTTGKRKAARGYAIWAGILNAAFCLMMAYSDRVTVYAGLILLTHVFYFGFAEGNRKLRFVMIYLTIMSAGAALIYLAWNIAAQDGIGEFVTKFLDNPRFNDLNRILMRLDESGLLGSGLGAQLNLPGISYSYPHNLFMADYFSAGIAGLFAAIFWFFVLAKFAVRGVFRLLNPRASSAEKRMMIGAVTIILYNMALTQLSAQGLFDLGDWVGLGIGLILFIKANQIDFYGERGNPVEINLGRNRARRSHRLGIPRPAWR